MSRLPPTDPRLRPRYNRYRIWVALWTVVIGAVSYYAAPMTCCAGLLREEPELFNVVHAGPEWSLGHLGFLVDFSLGGAIGAGIGWGDYGQVNLTASGQGGDVAGFMFGLQAHINKNGMAQSHWLVIRLPFWFILALLLHSRLERAACRRAARFYAGTRPFYPRQEALHRAQEREFVQHPICRSCGGDLSTMRKYCKACGWVPERHLTRALKRQMELYIDARKFDQKPVCRTCGYDLRATRDRCPECGWVPDPHLLANKGK